MLNGSTCNCYLHISSYTVVYMSVSQAQHEKPQKDNMTKTQQGKKTYTLL